MKVSIIIAVYNVEKYIESCLLSAIRQSYKNIEIILVDDCGSDSSIMLAEQIIEKNGVTDRCKIIKHPVNKGTAAARNTGLCAAAGDYVFILDSDDTVLENAIEILVSKLEKYPSADVVMGNSADFIDGKQISATNLQNNMFSGKDIFAEFIKDALIVSPTNKLINRKFIISNSIFLQEEIKVASDMPWFFTIVVNAEQLITIKEITYFYRIIQNSLYHKPFAERLPYIIAGAEYMLEYINSYHSERTDVLAWLERLKGAKLEESIGIYSRRKQLALYRMFRKYRYIREESVFDIHYRLPEFLGFEFYRFCIFVRYLRVKVYKRFKI